MKLKVNQFTFVKKDVDAAKMVDDLVIQGPLAQAPLFPVGPPLISDANAGDQLEVDEYHQEQLKEFKSEMHAVEVEANARDIVMAVEQSYFALEFEAGVQSQAHITND